MTSKPAKPFSQSVRSVSRALAVLNSFAGKSQQSLAEISGTTGLDKGTTRRLLLTLIENDYVAQDPATQRYRLGRGVHDLAANAVQGADLRAVARPHLMELASELSVTAFLSVFQDGAAVCLERIHDMRGIEVHWWPVGGTLPLNVGGAPKLLLAYQPAEAIAAHLRNGMRAMNEKSVLDEAVLTERLSLIRAQGWECAVDDVAVGLTALAVPVLDEDGQPICAVSIAGLTPQMVIDGHPVHLARLQLAAARIREELRLQ